ncbi:hypothetical protein E5288_WYG005724 [Bos mutus]|uniref:Uncharacterized protein n=1 Tax=Bos mutus TaxID=72004 RepID=A0A6B0RSJ4_9CETA|nr:hypothetical protein [Bos mutus]
MIVMFLSDECCGSRQAGAEALKADRKPKQWSFVIAGNFAHCSSASVADVFLSVVRKLAYGVSLGTKSSRSVIFPVT